MQETYDLLDYLQGRGIGNDQNAGRTLGRLHRAVHADRVVHYYQEESADLEARAEHLHPGQLRRHHPVLLWTCCLAWPQRSGKTGTRVVTSTS